MAHVIPFRGVTYNPEKIPDLAAVTTPPYDVISPEEQDAAYARHPNNVIRLILGHVRDTDSDADNRYTRAARDYGDWLEEGILVRDAQPAIYLAATGFAQDGRRITRYGLIALVKLEPFEKGIVLPHEKTFSRIKMDRLELMKACGANFSPVFALYPDADGFFDSLKGRIAGKAPDMAYVDRDGHDQKLWRLTDPEAARRVANHFSDKVIFIADGHHRYETALVYRDRVAETDPNFDETHPANYIMMSLTSMSDPGMVILPAHRLLKAVPPEQISRFLEKAPRYFDIRAFPFTPETRVSQTTAFLEALKAGATEKTVGIYVRESAEFKLLKMKPDALTAAFGDELPPPLMDLDVTMLTRLIFMELLGFDQDRLDNDQLIAYSSVAERALDITRQGVCDICFILNPTTVEQVRNIAQSGLIMPRKSTYFFPKVGTGQVINPLTRQA